MMKKYYQVPKTSLVQPAEYLLYEVIYPSGSNYQGNEAKGFNAEGSEETGSDEPDGSVWED